MLLLVSDDWPWDQSMTVEYHRKSVLSSVTGSCMSGLSDTTTFCSTGAAMDVDCSCWWPGTGSVNTLRSLALNSVTSVYTFSLVARDSMDDLVLYRNSEQLSPVKMLTLQGATAPCEKMQVFVAPKLIRKEIHSLVVLFAAVASGGAFDEYEYVTQSLSLPPYLINPFFF